MYRRVHVFSIPSALSADLAPTCTSILCPTAFVTFRKLVIFQARSNFVSCGKDTQFRSSQDPYTIGSSHNTDLRKIREIVSKPSSVPCFDNMTPAPPPCPIPPHYCLDAFILVSNGFYTSNWAMPAWAYRGSIIILLVQPLAAVAKQCGQVFYIIFCWTLNYYATCGHSRFQGFVFSLL